MNVVTLRTPLVVMLLALHVHEIEFVHQSVPFEQVQRAIDGHTIDAWVKFARVAKNLCGIEMLFRVLNNFENRPALMRHTQATR